MADITPPTRGVIFDRVDSRFGAFFEALARLAILENDGTPESVVDAGKTRLCLDTTNNVLYVKTTDFGTLTGWVALN